MPSSASGDEYKHLLSSIQSHDTIRYERGECKKIRRKSLENVEKLPSFALFSDLQELHRPGRAVLVLWEPAEGGGAGHDLERHRGRQLQGHQVILQLVSQFCQQQRYSKNETATKLTSSLSQILFDCNTAPNQIQLPL